MLSKLLYPIDRLVNRVSMYRLLLYYLLALIIAAIGFSAAGLIHYSAGDIAISGAVLIFSCWLINRVFAYIFNAPVNPESSLLTGMILTLIIAPTPSGYNLLFMLAAAGLAMASKYILTYRGKHIFNPAAVAVFLTAIGPHQTASWWVANAQLLPLVIVGGILVGRKIRRLPMVLMFLAATTLATVAFSLASHGNIGVNVKEMVLSSAAFFLGFVMLTEPFSAPDSKSKQLIYALIVGVILAPQFHIGHDYSTPEAALLIGNLFAFVFSNKTRLLPKLNRKYLIAKDSAEFSFQPDRPLSYQPGQYMEFTLPHTKADSRGSRRYFTLSSSPTEPDIKIAVRFYKDGSSYKSKLANISAQDRISAALLSGEFVMPKDQSRKLLFIAGGIGITPFRSMIKYLLDKHEQRDIILVYAARTPEYLAYRELFSAAAAQLGVQLCYIVDKGHSDSSEHILNGRIDADTISRYVPDLSERLCYVSGPLKMTEEVHVLLHGLGVSHANIKIDFFSGYA